MVACAIQAKLLQPFDLLPREYRFLWAYLVISNARQSASQCDIWHRTRIGHVCRRPAQARTGGLGHVAGFRARLDTHSGAKERTGAIMAVPESAH